MTKVTGGARNSARPDRGGRARLQDAPGERRWGASAAPATPPPAGPAEGSMALPSAGACGRPRSALCSGLKCPLSGAARRGVENIAGKYCEFAMRIEFSISCRWHTSGYATKFRSVVLLHLSHGMA